MECERWSHRPPEPMLWRQHTTRGTHGQALAAKRAGPTLHRRMPAAAVQEETRIPSPSPHSQLAPETVSGYGATRPHPMTQGTSCCDRGCHQRDPATVRRPLASSAMGRSARTHGSRGDKRVIRPALLRLPSTRRPRSTTVGVVRTPASLATLASSSTRDTRDRALTHCSKP